MRIDELLEPKKPVTAVKSSTVSKSGAQGSISKISQRQFTTSKGNNVKVWFKPAPVQNGEKSVDISFYVNDTMYDTASTEGKDIANDYEILSGVGYIVNTVLDKSKLNHCTFEAFGGERDSRVKYNIPPAKYIANLTKSLDTLYTTITTSKPTQDQVAAELERRNTLLAKVNKPLETSPVMIDPRLEPAITTLKEFITQPFTPDSIAQYNQLLSTIESASTFYVINNTNYSSLVNELYEFKDIVKSYSAHGAMVTNNRRASVYSKLLQKFFADKWNINMNHNRFELSRK